MRTWVACCQSWRIREGVPIIGETYMVLPAAGFFPILGETNKVPPAAGSKQVTGLHRMTCETFLRFRRRNIHMEKPKALTGQNMNA